MLTLAISTTSAVEGAHQKLKEQLRVSTGDLMYCVDRIEQYLTNQAHTVNEALNQAQIRLPNHLNLPLFSNVVSKISPTALKATVKQYELAKGALADRLLPECSGHTTRTMGIPCAHFILPLIQTGIDGKVGVEDFHVHWRMGRYRREGEQAEQLANPFEGVNEPEVILRSRGRQQASQAANSTRRNLSHFEVEEAELRASRRPGRRQIPVPHSQQPPRGGTLMQFDP